MGVPTFAIVLVDPIGVEVVLGHRGDPDMAVGGFGDIEKEIAGWFARWRRWVGAHNT